MFKSAIHKLHSFTAKLKGGQVRSEGEFSKLIKNRNQVFWKAPDVGMIRSTIFTAGDPIEKWKEGENWQRKLSNKFNSREFAKKHGCKVAELYWKGRDYNAIDFDNLPPQYVIRPTKGHSLGLVFLMNDSVNLMDGKTYTKEDIRNLLAEALDENQTLEILIEEFLKTEEGLYKIPADYKFYMFDGQIASIQVINRLSSSKASNTWYEENWKPMLNLTSNYPLGELQQPPACLPEMMEHAKRLSKAYEIFCRIDFYATDKGAVFGEFTPTPAVGNGFTPDGDKLLADYWDKYCKGMI